MRIRRRRTRLILLVAALVIVILARVGYDWLFREDSAPLTAGPCEVVRVVDGDTIIVRQQSQPPDRPRVREARVRLLGIDTPETVKPNAPVEPWGPEATEFTKRLTAEGNVRLELDKRRIDRYGRSLAYVYVGDRLLNEELVRAGLARVSVYPGDSATIERRLRAAEAEARKAERGIWSTVQVTSSQ